MNVLKKWLANYSAIRQKHHPNSPPTGEVLESLLQTCWEHADANPKIETPAALDRALAQMARDARNLIGHAEKKPVGSSSSPDTGGAARKGHRRNAVAFSVGDPANWRLSSGKLVPVLVQEVKEFACIIRTGRGHVRAVPTKYLSHR